MSDVPSNLIPTRVTQLPLAPVADENSLMMIVYQGNNYQIRVGDLLSVAGVPVTRQVIAGTGMTGGGQLSSNITLSIANGGVGSAQLASSGVTPGVYGTTTDIPVLTVDETGRVVAATTVPAVTSGFVPTTREVIAGTGLNGGGPLSSNVTLNANLSDATPQFGFQAGSAGVSTDISRADHKHPAVDLSDDDQVDNILGLSNGGTARSLVPNAGAVVWSGADGLYIGPAGVYGQVLTSGGTNQPIWASIDVDIPRPANTVRAGPTSGADAIPTFRALVNADIPSTLDGKTLTNVDINSGTIDGTTIGGSSPAAGTFTTVSATTVNATTVEATNLSAKDGTAAGSIANTTGIVTLNSAVLTTADVNGGTIDNAVIGGSTPAAITGTTITATTQFSGPGTGLTGTASGLSVGGSAGSATTATNIAGGAAGSIPYQTSASTTSLLAAGSGVLVGGSTPSYSTTPTLTGTNFSGIPNAALTNSSVTIGTTAISLGASSLTLGGLTSVAVTQNPTTALQVATKQYVDGLVSSGITYHTPVKYEVPDTTGNLSATYNNGTSGVGATLTNTGTLGAFTPDGVVASVNDRVLIYNQTNQFENGVYTVTTVGDGSTAWVLTRATDADTYGLKSPTALGEGDAFFVQSGNTGAGETYVCNTSGTITFGTTAITFVQISASQVYSAGTGLTLTGTQFSLTVPVVIANGGTGLTSFTAGDLPYYASGTALSKLGIGAASRILTSSGSAPQWTDPASVSVGSATTATSAGSATTATTATNIAGGAAGALPYQSGASTTALLAAGTNGYVLQANGAAAPSWVAQSTLSVGTASTATTAGSATTATTATNIAGGSTGAVAYNTGSGATTFLTLGTQNYVLTAGATAPQYVDQSTLSVGSASTATSATTATNIAGGAANQIPYQTGAATTSFVTAPVSSNTFLKWNGTAFTWDTAGAGTVTSVDVSGGTTGLTTSGGPVTSSGTITIAGTLNIANGGSGQTTAQAAMNAFAGATTSGYYLRGNGSNVVMAAIQAGDVPTLNQNTTGSAGSVTNSVTFTNTGGAAAGTTYNGSAARTIDYSTVGAPKTDGTGASGTWGISINGNAATATSATTATNLGGGAASQIPYQTGAGATTFLANGTAGQVLKSGGAGAPSWSNVAGGTF